MALLDRGAHDVRPAIYGLLATWPLRGLSSAHDESAPHPEAALGNARPFRRVHEDRIQECDPPSALLATWSGGGGLRAHLLRMVSNAGARSGPKAADHSTRHRTALTRIPTLCHHWRASLALSL